MMKAFASSAFTSPKPIRSASYSASLFVAGNCILAAYLKISPLAI